MGVPNVLYKWKSLKTLYVSVFVMNIAGCVIVMIMIVSAVKMRIGIGQYFDLVIPGDANFWPGMMFLIAFLCAPIYAIGIKLCFHLRFSSRNPVPRLNKVIFIHCMLSFASVIIVIGIIVIGVLRITDFHRINENGIIESMHEYATEVISKVRVDMIQINFRCCGSKSFKDWFHVRWMMQNGRDTPDTKDHNESSFVSTDVPFSCCATEMLQPCIHHNILKPSEVYLYKPGDRLTIATTGCHAKVLGHARHVGGLLIIALVLLAGYQLVLALLSRLLQTAHSNDSYIGPKKDRYLAWIFGSVPKAEMYNRLVYEDEETPGFEEVIPLRETLTDSRVSRMGEVDFEDKFLGEKFSKIFNAGRPSSSTIPRLEQRKKSSTSSEARKATSRSSTKINFVPAPPPSPGTEDKSIPEERTKPPYRGLKQGSQKSIEDRREKIDTTNRRKNLSKINGTQLEELRKSLDCLKKYQSPWRGGSPMFEMGKPLDPLRQSSRIEVSIERGKDFTESELGGSRSSSGSSSDYKNYKICGKDSIEEKEMRMKKFCKDLSTEYKMSPYSKQRRDFSEQFKCHEPTPIRKTDDGLLIRNEVCARFNPADTYSRFRGSDQDTMMRRSSQTNPGPPPIPIPNQRIVALQDRSMPRPEYIENSAFLGHALPCNQHPDSQFQTGGHSWSAHQKPGWGPRYPSAPTYFPISLRPPRPPRLPSCPYSVGHPPIRAPNFVQNEESVGRPCFKRCQGRCASVMRPPRFP